MKTMTCKKLGGPCNQPLSARSWSDMVRLIATHIAENHPVVAKQMARMHNDEPTRWGWEMKPKWMRFLQLRASFPTTVDRSTSNESLQLDVDVDETRRCYGMHRKLEAICEHRSCASV